jgi:hypothetical protein
MGGILEHIGVGGGGLHALVVRRLTIFISGVLEYIDVGVLNTLLIGGLNIFFMGSISEHIGVGGLHTLVVGELTIFRGILEYNDVGGFTPWLYES